MTDLLYAVLMLTFGGCILWAFTWLRNYVMRQYKIVKRAPLTYYSGYEAMAIGKADLVEAGHYEVRGHEAHPL